MGNGQKTKRMLVIEDSLDDAFLISRAFDSLPFCNAFICRNFSEARSYILGAGQYHDRLNFPEPQGVITDLHVAGDSAFQFVEWLKEHRRIPAFIITGRAAPGDHKAALRLGVRIAEKPM